MQTVAIILGIALIGVSLVLLYVFYRKLNALAKPSDDKSLLLLQNQIQDLAKVLDQKFGISAKQLQDNFFDAIFFDPFSPRSSPEMWSEEFFREMWRVMLPKAILATYSCARIVRDNMSKAGLLYADGPIFGRRGPGTIATKWM